jgi:hypothetical protein
LIRCSRAAWPERRDLLRSDARNQQADERVVLVFDPRGQKPDRSGPGQRGFANFVVKFKVRLGTLRKYLGAE